MLAAWLLLTLPDPSLTFCCPPENDLYRLASSSGRPFVRCESIDAAIRSARTGSGLLVLTGVKESAAQLKEAERKGLRQYLELPPAEGDGAKQIEWERAFVTTDLFGPELARDRILSIGRQPIAVRQAENTLLAMGRVAGFDRLAFGPPAQAYPLLWLQDAHTLISSAKLSSFATGRYAPSTAWKGLWSYVFKWLGDPSLAGSVVWQPSVGPSYSKGQALPKNYERVAQKRAADWFLHSHLLPTYTDVDIYNKADRWNDRVGPRPASNGDGSYGILEGYASQIDPSGHQPVRWYRRADCNAESAMALALAGDESQQKVATRLADFITFDSAASQGDHVDPEKASFGLIGWNDVSSGPKTFYGDDNARFILGMIAASGALHATRWDEAIERCILGNFRTSGVSGFRGNSLNQDEIEQAGWRHFYDADTVNMAPHFEAYLWACYLWAYSRTHYRPLLDRTIKGITRVMTSGENAWTWTNGSQQERARTLLPLSWLVRVDNTHEHRAWLDQTVKKILAYQADCGAIREEFGDLTHGIAGPPRSNDAYGTAETPMIQENGDPLADMLYTSNFALLGLHEAAAATGNPSYRKAENRLAEFLCRIQIRSRTHPELDGAWFRAFDYGDWDYWASNADLGWGAWSIETGWSVSWITAVLALRSRGESLWSLDPQFEPDLPLLHSMLAISPSSPRS